MRILLVNDVGFEAGGAEKSVRMIAEGFRARGHECRVVSTDRLVRGHEDVFADVVIPGIDGWAGKRLFGYFWYQTAYRAVKRELASFRPDLVHLHTIGEFSPSVLYATRGHRRVLTVHGPEDWTLELLRWKLVGAGSESGLGAGDWARLFYLRFMQRPFYRTQIRHLDLVIAPSRYMSNAVAVDVGRVRRVVVPNGLSLPSATPVRATREVLFVGRLERVKGVSVLLRAFSAVVAEHPDAHLTIVGDGAQRDALVAEAARLGITGSTRFTGWLGNAEILGLYRDCAVVVIPSVWPENFPTVALEALGVGRPLVVSDVGGIGDLVTHEQNGLVVPPGDIEGLATALSRLLGDPQLVGRLAAASAARAAEYDVGRFLDRLEEHYVEVVAQGRALRG